MKKLLAFVLSAALMLPLAACGGGSNHSDTSAATIKTNTISAEIHVPKNRHNPMKTAAVDFKKSISFSNLPYV